MCTSNCPCLGFDPEKWEEIDIDPTTLTYSERSEVNGIRYYSTFEECYPFLPVELQTIDKAVL